MSSLPIIYTATKIEDEDMKPCCSCVLMERTSDKRWKKNLKVQQAAIKRYSVKDSIRDLYDPTDVLIVADPPTPKDNALGSFWADSDGSNMIKMIKEAVADAGLESFVVVPAVRCYAGKIDHFVLQKKYKGNNNRKKDDAPVDYAKKAVEKCSEFVTRALNQFRPKVIVALGPIATKALKLTGTVAALRVTPLHHKAGLAAVSTKDGIMVTYDRAYARASQWARNDLIRDLTEKLPNLLTTGHAHPFGDRDSIQIQVLDTVAKVRKFVEFCFTSKDIPKGDFLFFDFETATLHRTKADNQILNVGFSFKSDPNRALVVPLMHPQTPFSPDELEEVWGLLGRLWQGKGAKFWAFGAHNAQFETQMIKVFWDIWLGEDGNKPIFDTQNFAFLLDENRRLSGINKPYTLETLASEFFGFRWYAETQMKQRRKSLSEEPIDVVNEYVGIDAAVTSRLAIILMERMEEEGSLEDLMNIAVKLYSDAILYTSDLTLTGQLVDVELLRKLRASDSYVTRRLREIEEAFAKAPEVRQAMRLVNKQVGKSENGIGPLFKSSATATQKFSLTSPEHRKALFWDVMRLEGADISVDKKFQEDHKNTVPLVALYQEFQQLSKLDSSYLEPTAKHLQEPQSVDGKIHPNFNLINTATGRLSASDPNSQNMPRDKKEIKAMFRAGAGNVLVQLDFSQAEIRWLGILSGDDVLVEKYATVEKLKEAIRKDPHNQELKRALTVDGDVHMSTALTMYNLPRDLPFTDAAAAKLARQKAKSVAFGLMYGKKARALSVDLKIDLDSAQDAIDRWLAQFPKSDAWLQKVDEDIAVTAVSRSPFGRWRRLPEAKSDDISVANRAKRQARNTPIQSAASDFCIYAACKLRRALRTHPDPRLREMTKLINTVHDSLIAEVPADPEVVAAYCKLAKDIFTDQHLIERDFGIVANVPLAVDFEIGVNWGNMREYDFSKKSLDRALYDAEVLRKSPPGTLFKQLAGKGLLYDEVYATKAA